jgi:hypothetical protein
MMCLPLRACDQRTSRRDLPRRLAFVVAPEGGVLGNGPESDVEALQSLIPDFIVV